MSNVKTCSRCKASFDLTHFIGVRGGIVQSCAHCRGKHVAGNPPPHLPPLSVVTPSPGSQHRRRSLSPSPRPSATSNTSRSSPAYASAAGLMALECCFTRLECQVQDRFDQLLAAIHARSHPDHFPPSAASTSQLLWPTLATTSAAPNPSGLTNPGHVHHAVGELSPPSSACCFSWVTPDVVDKVAQDRLKPEELVRLRNPESSVSKEPARQTGLVLSNGQITVAEDSTDTCTSTFLKAIPNIAALAQVWLAYTAIRVRHTRNLELNEALLAHLEYLIDFESMYSWRALVDYHLAVCRHCFGTGAVHEWAHANQQLQSRILLPNIKPNTAGQRYNPASGSLRHVNSGRVQRASRSGSEPCKRFNAGHCTPNCPRNHVCIHCHGPHGLHRCTAIAGSQRSGDSTVVKKAN